MIRILTMFCILLSGVFYVHARIPTDRERLGNIAKSVDKSFIGAVNPSLLIFDTVSVFSSVNFLGGFKKNNIEGSNLSGNKHIFNVFDANGKHETGKLILAGKFAYSNQRYFGAKWNLVSNPELFGPYITSDTIGGNLIMEYYMFEGDFSCKTSWGSWGGGTSYNASGMFRRTDPRNSNNVSDIDIRVGLSYKLNVGYFAMCISTGRYKQNIAVSNFQADKKNFIYIQRGIGLYNKLLSVNYDSFGQKYLGKKYSLSIDYISTIKEGLRCSYTFSLYNITTDFGTVKPATYNKYFQAVTAKYNVTGAKFRHSLFFNGSYFSGIGTERIYEYVLADKATKTYNYIELASASFYFQKQTFAEIGWKINGKSKVNRFSFILNNGIYSFSEKHKEGNLKQSFSQYFVSVSPGCNFSISKLKNYLSLEYKSFFLLGDATTYPVNYSVTSLEENVVKSYISPLYKYNSLSRKELGILHKSNYKINSKVSIEVCLTASIVSQNNNKNTCFTFQTGIIF